MTAARSIFPKTPEGYYQLSEQDVLYPLSRLMGPLSFVHLAQEQSKSYSDPLWAALSRMVKSTPKTPSYQLEMHPVGKQPFQFSGQYADIKVFVEAAVNAYTKTITA